MQRLKKVLKWTGIVLGGLVLLLAVILFVAHDPRPDGEPGPEAEELAVRMEAAVDVEAWARTGAVRWGFGGRQEHLWDRERGVARVRWDDVEALFHVGSSSGRVWRAGREVHGEEARELLAQANAHWVNDSFWLNPVAKFRDEGVRRELVTLEDGTDALLVRYTSGGLTPGDAYLWIPGEGGLPREWRMWVSIIPVGGVATTWEGWQTLSTGAKIATRHEGPLGITLELDDVAGAATLAELTGGEDPFAPLFDDEGD
ncbi:MAG TPA: hypothetical protein RMH99_04005 [Sandaracinaceae bacterium LLY-WYZ-13_1]|nr:hypothetical protein [Sandaracinaceae bacterium LLY-WYZ-13_1]